MRPYGPVSVLAGLVAVSSLGCTYRVASDGERLQAPYPDHGVAALPAGPIDILVWNVYKARREGWALEYAALAAGTELVLIQEAHRGRLMDQVLMDSQPSWRMGVSFFVAGSRGREETRGQRSATGVATGAVATPTCARVEHSPGKEPITSTPKAALLTWYAIEGRDAPLLVVNIHAINFRPARQLERQLAPIEAAIQRHEGPVILGGDFNTHHARRMRALEPLVQRLGMRAVFPYGPDSDARTRVGGWPLDHVFVRGMTVETASVPAGSVGSDHVPLTVRLQATD